MEIVNFKLIYDGKGPLIWNGAANDFGLQDKDGHLAKGSSGAGSTIIFEFSLEVKSATSGAPVFVGPFCHGSPKERFLYLSWRNVQGNFAQRLKLPLNGISAFDVQTAISQQATIVGLLNDHHPRVTTTGANNGGSRMMHWEVT